MGSTSSRPAPRSSRPVARVPVGRIMACWLGRCAIVVAGFLIHLTLTDEAPRHGLASVPGIVIGLLPTFLVHVGVPGLAMGVVAVIGALLARRWPRLAQLWLGLCFLGPATLIVALTPMDSSDRFSRGVTALLLLFFLLALADLATVRDGRRPGLVPGVGDGKLLD